MIWGFDMDFVKEFVLVCVVGFKCVVEVGSDGFCRKGFCCGVVVVVIEYEGEFVCVVWLKDDVEGECCVGIVIMVYLVG